MKAKYLLLGLLLSIVFCSCSSVQKRQSKQTAILSTAISDSIKVGRFDRAKEFSDQLVKLTPPVKPKEKIKINQFKTVKVNVAKKGIFTKEELIPDKTFVVLPPGFDVSNIVVKNDKTFLDILEQNPNLKKEEIKVDKIVDKSDKTVDRILIDKERELEKSRGQNKGFFSTIFGWVKGIFGWGALASLIVIIVSILFFPAALPFIFSFIKGTFNWFLALINGLFRGVMGWFGK